MCLVKEKTDVYVFVVEMICGLAQKRQIIYVESILTTSISGHSTCPQFRTEARV
jgi:hypothetical protein